MANTLTPVDVYAIVNELAEQITGEKSVAVVDTDSFVSVGETLLRSGTENVLNALSGMVVKTIYSVRPYTSNLRVLYTTPERWGAQIRKIVPLYDGGEQTTDNNTNLAATQLDDDQSVDMFKIKKKKAIQLNFYGTKTYQKHITIFRDQLSIAFKSEAEFAAFYDALMVEFNNELEVAEEAKSRAVLLNAIGGIDKMGLTKVDLAEGFNTEFGTKYTRADLLGAHLPEFMKYVASEIKIYSKNMEDFSSMYHANLNNATIMRHTPRQFQKMIMYNPIFIKAESEVYSSLFNPKYLDIGDFQGVNFWQDKKDPTKVQVKPNYLNTATGESTSSSSTVKLDYVLGLLFDQEALGVIPQFDYSAASPFNAAGGYWNQFVHSRFCSFTDFTENMILFVIGEGYVASTKG